MVEAEPASSRMPAVLWIAIAALIASMVEFTNVNGMWLRPFTRDLLHWIAAPQISGSPQAPTAIPFAALLYGLAGTASWLLSGVALGGTELARDRTARIGIAIVVAFCLVGYAGMIGLVLGNVRSGQVWLIVAIGLAVGLIAWLSIRRPGAVDQAAIGTERPLLDMRVEPTNIRWLAFGLSAVVIFFSAIHSLMAPVTEIDATIYHAAAAKLWFVTGPNPALLYGPSIGIEISGNYPPIFPAIGLATYSAIGRFDDLYLRAVPPLLGAALLLITYAYARWHSGSRNASWVIVLLLGSPLLVMYMAWTTNYILLAVLTVLVLLFCELGATSMRWTAWAAAGLFAGLAVLTNFYGWVTCIFPILAVLIWHRSWRGVYRLGLFTVVAACVAAPWLFRNWHELGDPIYPLADHIFHGAGLVQPFWSATESDIQHSALSLYGLATGLKLLSLESAVAFESNYLIPAGLVMGIVVGLWRSKQRDGRALYLTTAVLLIAAEVLTPGWYWVRALLPLVPVGALLAGLALQTSFKWAEQRRRTNAVDGFGGGLWGASLVGLAVLSTATSLALSVAGPNQQTWTTSLPASSDFMQSVRNLGSPDKQLATAFGPDYACWQWMNGHVGPNDRIATYEIRMYYFDRPQSLFYLDGLEAVPLVNMHSPSPIRDYLSSHGVRLVMIPGWARNNGSAQLLPLTKLLGTQGEFPLLGDWGGTDVYALNPHDPLAIGTRQTP
jgi:4-amino-4-deoxy-L-arabinose transferase-like glycosyltransferase